MSKDAELTEAQIDLIAQRCDAATSGPWVSSVEGRDHVSGSSFIRTSVDDIELSGATIADQDFIASARQDVPRLVEEIRRLRRKLPKSLE